MRRLALLAILSVYSGSCAKSFDTSCPEDELVFPATYSGEPDDAYVDDLWNVVLEVSSRDEATLAWSDASGDHVAEYTISDFLH